MRSISIISVQFKAARVLELISVFFCFHFIYLSVLIFSLILFLICKPLSLDLFHVVFSLTAFLELMESITGD